MRPPSIRRTVRFLFLLVLFIFVVLNMHILVSFQPNTGVGSYAHPDLDGHMHKDHSHVQFGRSEKGVDNYSYDTHDTQFIIPANFFNASSDDKDRPTVDYQNLTQIKRVILKINQEQHIYNLNRFGLRFTSESVVIVVQIHDRGEYLKLLIESLRNVKNIEKTLLVFSHDVYSHELNRLVQEINFAPVLQIFFPYSLQLHPHSFPGEHPNDCPRNIKKEEALLKKCNNAAYPDKYGHYREARYCQTKHHWFWKLHHVFDGVNVMKNYQGLVLLLEEDYYVTPDIVTILQMMQNLRQKDCKECKMLAAGNYDKVQNYGANSGKVEVANWISSRHNMGMAFTAGLWQEIKRCAQEFCNFDDYNWDWTLQHLSHRCITNQIKVLKMKATRVFHMGDCGVHHKGKNCKPEEKRDAVQQIIDRNKQHLFPNVISIGSYSGIKLRDPKPNGGWGDLRDRQLCISFINNSTSKLHV